MPVLIKYPPMKYTRFFWPLLAATLAACQPTMANRGNFVDDERLSQIKVGETDQASVQSTLGPPTMIGTFDKKTWYYSGKRTEKEAFFKPDTKAERTLIVHFDDAGTVDKITEVSADQQVAVNPENAITPTEGRAMGFVDQIIENMNHPGLPGSLGSSASRAPGAPGRTVGAPGS